MNIAQRFSVLISAPGAADPLLALWKRKQTFLNKHHVLVTVAKALIIGLVFFAICWKHLDPDFGWHLQAGNYIRAHGIPMHDVFTYSARDFPWIDHEWGSDVLVSLLYGWGGFGILSLLFAGLWTAALFVSERRASIIILLLATTALFTYTGVRPVAWTILGVAILIKLMTNAARRWWLVVPVMFAIWANLHGGFIFGFIILGYYMVRKRSLLLAMLLPLSILASFLNPYGPSLYTEIFRTLFDSTLHAQINEWRRFYVPSYAWAFVALWVIGFVLYRIKKPNNWFGIGPLLLASAMSATRNLPLFITAGVRDLQEFYMQFRRSLPQPLPMRLKALLGLGLALMISWVIGCYVTFFESMPSWQLGYPVQAVAYLRQHPCDGNLFNEYNYGGYLIWQLPSQPVYIDGRMPSWRDVSGQKYLDRYYKVIHSPGYQAQQFAQYNIRCVLLTKGSVNNPLMDRLTHDDWATVLETSNYALLVAPHN